MMLEGKTGFITGGSKGIGLGIAQSMLDQGMNIVITGRNHETIETAMIQLNGDTSRKLGVVSDVRSLDSEQNAIKEAISKFGQIDAVIANAGVGHFSPIQEMTSEQWKDVIDINLTGVFNTTKASLDALIKSKGYLITIASLAGTNFFAKGAAYNASKFGLVGFTQAVMMDLRQHDVKVSTIMPGSVSTFFNNHIPSDADAWKIQPEDIGKLVIDLLLMSPRTLPSKIEVRPSKPPSKK